MTKDELAETLRTKLTERCERGELDASLPAGREPFLETLRQTSHDDLIAGFLKCPVCGEMAMPVERAAQLAAHLRGVDDWIKGIAIWRQHFGRCHH